MRGQIPFLSQVHGIKRLYLAVRNSHWRILYQAAARPESKRTSSFANCSLLELDERRILFDSSAIISIYVCQAKVNDKINIEIILTRIWNLIALSKFEHTFAYM